MNFRPELAAKVMAGEKTVTRRLVSENPRSPWWQGACRLREGRTYAVCPGRGKEQIGRVEVVSVTKQHLGALTDAEAQAEGFADATAFVLAWAEINGGYDPTSVVWRVEFRVWERSDA